MRRSFRYRLYPTKKQAETMAGQLAEACKLYNAALQERREAWKQARKSINYYHQAKQLKEIRAEGLTQVANFSCCQDILKRLDKTFRAFFRRVKNGDNPGYPRFRPSSRYNSITFPAYGDGVRLLPSRRLRVHGIGCIKIKLHRPVAGTIKTVTLKREAGKWYACFSVIAEAVSLKPSLEPIGIDVGLESFCVLSDGTVVANPRFFLKAQARLRRANRRVARRKRASKGRCQAIRHLQAAHVKVRNQRLDFHHKLAHELVKRYGLIAIEDLDIQGLARSFLAKSVNDVGWSDFFNMLAYKAESAGRRLITVNPRGTSQRCSSCGAEVRKTLKDRWHECSMCGLSMSRDLNSAREILRLGRSLVAST